MLHVMQPLHGTDGQALAVAEKERHMGLLQRRTVPQAAKDVGNSLINKDKWGMGRIMIIAICDIQDTDTPNLSVTSMSANLCCLRSTATPYHERRFVRRNRRIGQLPVVETSYLYKYKTKYKVGPYIVAGIRDGYPKRCAYLRAILVTARPTNGIYSPCNCFII